MFKITAGSFTGRGHLVGGTGINKLMMGGNNQDAYYIYSDLNDKDTNLLAVDCVISNNFTTIGVVTDGCSSSKCSEFGAHLGARMLGSNIQWYTAHGVDLLHTISLSYANLMEEVMKLAKNMLEDVSIDRTPTEINRILNEYFMFTIVGFVMNNTRTVMFTLGDGVYGINGNYIRIPHNVENKPIYCCYSLMTSLPHHVTPDDMIPKIVVDCNTDSVDTILVATDGFEYYLDNLDKKIAGTNTVLSTIDLYDDVFFKNKDNITRHLRKCTSSYTYIDWERNEVTEDPPILSVDDTTIIVAKRG
jgi:hypothetical protein